MYKISEDGTEHSKSNKSKMDLSVNKTIVQTTARPIRHEFEAQMNYFDAENNSISAVVMDKIRK